MNIVKHLIVYSIILFSFATITNDAFATDLKNTFPKLANYYLKWEISDREAEQLAKWDLLILDMEVQENSPNALKKIREINPDITILAYITSQEIMDDFIYHNLAHLRPQLKSGIIDTWYLKDESGNRISYWPGTHMLNVSNVAPRNSQGMRFNDYFPNFVYQKIYSSGYFDGVFFDNAWGDVAWINGANIDIDNSGRRNSVSDLNRLWSEGYLQMINNTRKLVGDNFYIIGNGRSHMPYQSVFNGMMFEDFPSSWEGDGSWAGSMNTYLNLPNINKQPSINVINSYDKNQFDYQSMRFSLASTLLGDGYFSYDYDTTNHTQLWWYDEYDIDLGSSVSAAYNPKNASNAITNSVYRRDFEGGSVFVNASNSREIQIFSQETFSKPLGNQDPGFNNGERINYLDLMPKTAAILLGSNDKAIKNTSFSNGFFYRYLNGAGNQVKPASFSYLNAYQGSSETIILSTRNGDTTINGWRGLIQIANNGKTTSFRPFPLFQGSLSIAVTKNANNELDRIIVGPGNGGGPQVLVFDANGNLISNFFAYDKSLRGGVNVAVADLNCDGNYQIITAPGRATEPMIRVFDMRGIFDKQFLAYDRNFRGGVSVAAGDMNNDCHAEIVTIPASSGGPHVRIFNSNGNAVGGFFAFDNNVRDQFKIGLSDLNSNSKLEIVVGRQNPY